LPAVAGLVGKSAVQENKKSHSLWAGEWRRGCPIYKQPGLKREEDVAKKAPENA
jgi:hypothetical protein